MAVKVILEVQAKPGTRGRIGCIILVYLAGNARS